MKILILTTQTTHHTKFISDIVAIYPDCKAVMETRSLTAPFDTFHDYLLQQDAYEKELWFDNKDIAISDIVETISVNNINDVQSLSFIKNYNPDLVVVFGTGKILPEIINLAKGRIINLHGGDPEQYRGLDTHLWAIYHGEFDQLITCLHEVAPELDTGNIIERKSIDLFKSMELYQLRSQNTKCCVEMVLNAIDRFDKQGKIITTEQTQKGRYYSFMPAVLKELCVKKFRRYTDDLS